MQSHNNLLRDLIKNLGCHKFGNVISTYKIGPDIRNVNIIAGQTYKNIQSRLALILGYFTKISVSLSSYIVQQDISTQMNPRRNERG